MLAHKILIAGAKTKKFKVTVVGIDMSKAFDTVKRSQILDLIRDWGVEEGDIGLIKLLLNKTSLQIKSGKKIGSKFQTDIGVPQGDGLSPILFTILLDAALRKVEEKLAHLRGRTVDHNYSRPGSGIRMHGHDYANVGCPNIPDHLEYADDVDFIFIEEGVDINEALKIIKETLSSFNLLVNEGKTEIVKYERKTDLKKIKKLGTILDETTEINHRKQFAALALNKYRAIWKNKYISVKCKIRIYCTYVKSILLYNCSTWTSNKTISQSLDSFHRKQLRRCLNIHYPKIIKNEDLYIKTGEIPISDTIKQRRTKHLGHTLRRANPARDILYNIYRKPPNSRGAHPANILKTYGKDFESPNLDEWYTLAAARRL